MNITTIGGATVDIIVSGSHGARGEGAKQDVDSIGLHMGGGAVNAALGFLACGADAVHAVCAVGSDVEGAWLRASLARGGVGLDGLQVIERAPTGKAVVHLAADGEASVFAQRGASVQLSVDAMPAHLLEAGMVYVSALSDAAATELAAALKATRQRPSRLVLNPGARQLASAGASLSSLLDMADLVCVNAHEAQLLAGVPPGDVNAHPTGLALDGLQDLLARIGRRTRAGVLVTLGPKGAAFFNGRETHHCPAAVTRVVSTLGAGDAYASAFAFHWASGEGARQAMTAATARAAAVLGVAAANLGGQLASSLVERLGVDAVD
ncbi:ribokinase [Variovorax boronicumulans]|uniref:carbohydrate kinase family protein n=1 Tax=Variovorax boronicumulans TaxID=436515 RepID=UPI00277F6B18|nr:PfkB family carbohydrate kinase [Variovorax boronicumulans]MDQ0073300.1 ribokinase [Variovorax boronicumulans]